MPTLTGRGEQCKPQAVEARCHPAFVQHCSFCAFHVGSPSLWEFELTSPRESERHESRHQGNEYGNQATQDFSPDLPCLQVALLGLLYLTLKRGHSGRLQIPGVARSSTDPVLVLVVLVAIRFLGGDDVVPPRAAEQALSFNAVELFLEMGTFLHVFPDEQFSLIPFYLSDPRSVISVTPS